MPLPRSLARFNRRATNRVLGPVVARLPGFAIVEHVGRRSGRTYRTPVGLFRRDDGRGDGRGDDHGERYVVALTYGRDSDWARNVLAQGGCVARMRGRSVALGGAELVHDPTHALVPRPVRPVLRLGGVDDFLVLRPVSAPPS